MSTPPLAVALIPDGTNTDAAERGNRGVGSRYVRERENAAPAFLPSGKGRGGVAPVSRNGPRRFCRLSSPIRHYFPDCWAVNWSAAGTAHGNLTPPRISPSCPHYVPLWLGRSTIVRGQDHCEAACQSCFWMDGYRSSPSWAVFIQKICTGGLRASSASLFHFWLIRLMSFQSLDMYFSSCTRRTENVPSMHRPRERLFYKVV